MKRTRKGFTLIKLLVVISILAALSAVMAISSSSAIASAKAATIVSNLQAIKTGAIVFYSDYRDVSNDAEFTVTNFNNVSNDYLDEPTIKMINKEGRYALSIISGGTGKPQLWYVGYALNNAETDNAQVLKKLIARADRFGLIGGTATAPADTSSKYTFTALTASGKTITNTAAVAKTSTAVWMKVR